MEPDFDKVIPDPRLKEVVLLPKECQRLIGVRVCDIISCQWDRPEG